VYVGFTDVNDVSWLLLPAHVSSSFTAQVFFDLADVVDGETLEVLGLFGSVKLQNCKTILRHTDLDSHRSSFFTLRVLLVTGHAHVHISG
jgi:hypothetical protein